MMLSLAAIFVSMCLHRTVLAIPLNTVANNIEVVKELTLAPTALDRILALPNPADHIFDFNNPPANSTTTGKGGHTVKADRLGFPALIGNGASMTLGFIGPCGFNTPHTHPRATEVNIVVEGRLATEFILENGAPTIFNTLEKYQMTVFPQGATHTEFNPDCTDAVFVAAFPNEDPGVQQSAQTLFNLDEDIVQAVLDIETFEGADIERIRSALPRNVALGVDACLKKCGITAKRGD